MRIVLMGGSRDGESITVADDATHIRLPKAAPTPKRYSDCRAGLDVYGIEDWAPRPFTHEGRRGVAWVLSGTDDEAAKALIEKHYGIKF